MRNCLLVWEVFPKLTLHRPQLIFLFFYFDILNPDYISVKVSPCHLMVNSMCMTWCLSYLHPSFCPRLSSSSFQRLCITSFTAIRRRSLFIEPWPMWLVYSWGWRRWDGGCRSRAARSSPQGLPAALLKRTQWRKTLVTPNRAQRAHTPAHTAVRKQSLVTSGPFHLSRSSLLCWMSRP